MSHPITSTGVNRYATYRLPKSFKQQESDNNRPSKRPKTMKKSKGKKPVRVIDDELEYDSNSEEREEHELDELNVKGARVCLYLHFSSSLVQLFQIKLN